MCNLPNFVLVTEDNLHKFLELASKQTLEHLSQLYWVYKSIEKKIPQY